MAESIAHPNAATNPEIAKEPPARLLSLDVYRGAVMLLMVSEGFNLSDVAAHFKESRFWQFLDYQTSHAPWIGCALWDLIQPSFMFIVGVAMPYSFAARAGRGDSILKQWGHVLFRAFALIALGIFLRSNRASMTNYTFEDVTTQLGLGYVFVYLFLGRDWRIQIGGIVAILFGYWALFALWPLPWPELDFKAMHVPEDWDQLTGFAAHWNKSLNPAGAFDRWFLNLFPRKFEYFYNGGGYATLSFIPSIATTLLGVRAGEMLRSSRPLNEKIKLLFISGAGLLAIAMALDGTIWPFMNWQWSLCPIVKRIWTPTWVLFSGGWTLLALGAFVWTIDARGWKRWTFPFMIVGMNPLAMYVMSYLFRGWVEQTLMTHLGADIFKGNYGPALEAASVLLVLWLFCLWMYRKKVFVRL